jgi:hypothetical protein
MVGQSVLLGQTAVVDSVVGSMLHFEEKSCSLELVIAAFGIGCNHRFLPLKPESSLPCE